VEGAGGVLVPLNERDMTSDLIRQIGFPVIVAARTSLGTINHTLLTLSALRQARLPICGVAMIGEENIENRRAIEHYGQVPVVGRIPKLQEINRASLLEAYETHFDHRAFE
jgi:malonyl-CoA O-methyltransferase